VNLVQARLVDADLTRADLTKADLYKANLMEADLTKAVLREVNLVEARLAFADLTEADLTKANLHKANLMNAHLTEAVLKRVNLVEAKLMGSYFFKAGLFKANLTKANLRNADLTEADLRKADLTAADLSGADLSGANLYKATLAAADLSGARLLQANLGKVNLTEAKLLAANLTEADLMGADLTGAVLMLATLVMTNIEGATLTSNTIYGLSAWSLKGTPKQQSNLIITHAEEPQITVGDLLVAQFVYLLLNNKNVRSVIDTITSKAVLLLGSFKPERKKVIDALREELHHHNYVPIVFDYEQPESQSLLETVMTLAGMARFIIADVTAATMVREELRTLVEKFPSKPIQPILLRTEQEYVTLPEMIKRYNSLLTTYAYRDEQEAIACLKERITGPAEEWLKVQGQQLPAGNNTPREIELEKENQALRAENARLKGQ
jgi:uncharacterized protein YjbI with pentapeptide repeats